MPWNAGIFTRSNGEFTGPTVWQQDEAALYDIDSDRHDVHDEDIAEGISACLNKNGENTMLADLKMGGNTASGLGTGSADDESMNKGQADAAFFKRDGSSPATANIDMGGFAITNIATPVAATDGVPLSYAQTSTGVVGNIAANGSINAGTGFTINKTGTGVYQINFTAASSGTNNQAVIVSVSVGAGYAVQAELNSTTRATAYIVAYVGASSSPVDSDFMLERRFA
jgi:hypothetical protein